MAETAPETAIDAATAAATAAGHADRAALAGACRDLRLGVVAAMNANAHDGRVWFHATLGRILDHFADRFGHVSICAPTAFQPPPRSRDFGMDQSRVTLIPQPDWRSSMAALRYPLAIRRAFRQLCRNSDVIFVRGLQPWLQLLYLRRLFGGPPIVHWLVGDPVFGTRHDPTVPTLRRHLIVAYCLMEQISTHMLSRMTRGTLVCNGDALARQYRTPRTHAVVSTAIYAHEIHAREDTCGGDVIRILYVGFLRTGKGLTFLIDALARLKTSRPFELAIVGAADKFDDDRRKLDQRIASLGLTDRVRFTGYATYGAPLFEELRKGDLLVLPSLSEGTPRALIDARAQGVPVISTNVGGVTSSVEHERDGLLVPPANADAIAAAIDRVIEDGCLRRRLVAGGLDRVRAHTLERFTETLDRLLVQAAHGPRR